MGEIIEFRRRLPVRCKSCGERMVYEKDEEAILCIVEHCGNGYVPGVVVTRKNGYTIIEALDAAVVDDADADD
jgi:hypothetical protein